MTLPNTPMRLSVKSQAAIIEYLKQCYNLFNKGANIRSKLRQHDLAYNREKNLLTENAKAKQANKYGDQNKIQDLTIPVVMPQVESAVVYQTSVFLQGTPIFGVAPSPQFAKQGLQLESLMADHATKGGWVRELQMAFRDGFKYNLAAAEVVWDRKVTASLDTDINFGNGRQGKPKEVIWQGNCINRLDLYNSFWDIRVVPTKVHTDGEFAGYNRLMTRIKLKQFIQELPDVMGNNIVKAFESSNAQASITTAESGIQNFHIPDLNVGGGLIDAISNNFSWMSWAGLANQEDAKIKYKDTYVITILYARILPSDFGLIVPQANTPQVWKFIIINGQVIIYAERQTNAHNYLPIIFMQPNEDGLGYQTKSLAKNVEPIQEISSALMNSVLAARRRAISDRGLYDPSRVDAKHINSTNPSAKIPVKPSAYGKPLDEAYKSIPFSDDQSPIMMQQIAMLGQFANQISGQNPTKQGQFVKGNKTTHEFDTTMGNANGRDQATSMLLEAQFFTPCKEILKLNILQYQGPGDVYNPKQKTQVTIDPVALRKASLEFKISDGLTPTDKLINGDVLAVAFQQIGTPNSPVAAGYNVAPMFTYLMNTQGADLSAFEKSPEQMAFEQATSQWQQTCMQIAKDNKDITPDKYPPQPLPQQFNYQPAGNNPGNSEEQQESQQQGQSAPSA